LFSQLLSLVPVKIEASVMTVDSKAAVREVLEEDSTNED
jgi:hypothetical protein